jgi:hypothetical protein
MVKWMFIVRISVSGVQSELEDHRRPGGTAEAAPVRPGAGEYSQPTGD